MLQNNPILTQLKQQMEYDSPRVQGTIRKSSRGCGFLDVQGNKSYFIPSQFMKKVMHGDQVIAKLFVARSQIIAQPEKLIQSALTTFIGQIEKRSTKLYIISDRPMLCTVPILCIVPKKLSIVLTHGDWVRVVLKGHPLTSTSSCGFYAEFIEYITHSQDKFAPWWVTLARYQMVSKAPDPILDLPIIDKDIIRCDLTEFPFITIDGKTTQDMDDALMVTKDPKGDMILTIAIADPTAYIDVESYVDRTARQRGFTLYLPGIDIPMLPRTLSDDLCALQPGKRRLALVCQVTVTQDGSLLPGATFLTAWIQVKAKLTYEQVSAWLENSRSWQPESEAIADQILLLQQMAQRRHEWRQKHAILFKEKQDYRFIIGSDGEVCDVVREPRTIAHHIVEEAMVAANLCAAILLRDRLGEAIFNVHVGLNPAHIEQVIGLLESQHVRFSKEELLTLTGYSQFRRYLDTQPSRYLEGRIRRYFTKSTLSCHPANHFGMGFDVYATWTSPIRKYSDLVNHRLLKSLITNRMPIQKPDLALVTHLNEKRQQHSLAQRHLTDWLYALFFKNKIDDHTPIESEITSITRHGMRVRLLNYGAVIFLPSARIHPIKEQLVCHQENASVTIDGEVVYRIGDRLHVILHKVIEKQRSIVINLA